MKAEGWVLEAAQKPLVKQAFELAPGERDAVVAVDACGLCHTDLGFADGSVAPKHALPLVLGHEIVGTVTQAPAGFASLAGRAVIVPAVIPCGDCSYCRAGRGNICPRQKMPGNDVHGGFASHVAVPAWALVPVDDAPASVDRKHLAVVADAVSTAYQAIRRSGLAKGDAAFVVGAGGVGGYLVQLARALGARVVACDVSKDKLALIAAHGAELTFDVTGRAPKEVRKDVHAAAKGWGIASHAFRIFETSGTPAGQTLAFTLLAPAATMVQVGFTPKTVEVRLSNLMAFDATLHGSWGCPPALYPEVLRHIYAGEVALEPFVEQAPMSRLNQALDDMAHHRLTRRLVLDPRA
ncbi:MAG: 6-hydroxycyclohex-1-ene-1-carbonyl-CoA dehydrogenase [Myxococcales bacterium]|nr:6-hydroxycyclohex-1-ene-1-carbonyl-CoA dehydrogenase [Myxococcales bacterium]